MAFDQARHQRGARQFHGFGPGCIHACRWTGGIHPVTSHPDHPPFMNGFAVEDARRVKERDGAGFARGRLRQRGTGNQNEKQGETHPVVTHEAIITYVIAVTLA